MGIVNRVLNTRIDLNMEISKKKAALSIALLVVAIMISGRFLMSRFANSGGSYYDLREQELKSTLANSPANTGAALELALTAYLKGDTDQGIKLAQELYQQNPKDPSAAFYLGIMLNDAGDFKESFSLLNRLAQNNPGFQTAKVRFYLGRSQYEFGKYQQAVASLQQSVLYDASYPVAYYYMGQAWVKLGKPEEAKKAYQTALSLNPNYPEVKQALAQLTN